MDYKINRTLESWWSIAITARLVW